MKTIRFDDPRLPGLMQSGAIHSGYGVGPGEADGYILDEYDEDDKRGCFGGMLEAIEFGHQPKCWCGMHKPEEIPDAAEQARLRKQWAEQDAATTRLLDLVRPRREEW